MTGGSSNPSVIFLVTLPLGKQFEYAKRPFSDHRGVGARAHFPHATDHFVAVHAHR